MSQPVTLHAPFAGWLSSLDEVADPVFAGRMMGEGFAIDPTEGVLRAPADGEVVSIAETSHAATLRLVNGAELLLHIGLDTVALRGEGFEAKVRAGDRVASGDALIAFDLDTVAARARDLVTPLVLPGEGLSITIDRPGRMVAAGEAIATVAGAAPAQATVSAGLALTRTIAVTGPHGLHARPAARIVALLKPYAVDMTLERGGRSADARSTTALLALGARSGDTLSAYATGADAAAALDALAAFATERFGDPVDASAVASYDAPRAGTGVCAAPGLAIGRIHQFRVGDVSVDPRSHGATVEAQALARARLQVGAGLGGAGAAGEIAEAHRAILDDPELRRVADAAITAGASAGTAWRQAIRAATTALVATGDARLLERVADLADLERQVLLALGGHAAPQPPIPADAILIAEDLLPSQFLALDRMRLAGIVTAAGGPTAHVAILAGAAGVPMMVAAGPGVLAHAEGVPAILDADAATLTVDPPAAALAEASARRAALRDARAAAVREAQTPAATADGTRIEVFANLGSAADAAAAVRAGAEGCGLLRTEFLFLDRATAPDVDEQAAAYREIAATLGDRPLIVRTLDIGGDKPVAYLPRTPEENPALGRRGVRLSLARPDLFAAQLDAILAAMPAAQCRIMLPMVADTGELAAARALLDAARERAGITRAIQLGVMIETPAAAVLADQLAETADFLSIGTNDLTQYVLAADRGNAAVATMVDALHPAVLRLIASAAAGAATHGRWTGVCGALASDPRAAALLIGLGVTELSAVPAAVPQVKAAVRATTLEAARALATKALACSSADDVRALLGAAA